MQPCTPVVHFSKTTSTMEQFAHGSEFLWILPTPHHDQRNIISVTWTWTLTSHPTPSHDQRNIISVTWTWTLKSHPTPSSNKNRKTKKMAPCSAHGNYITKLSCIVSLDVHQDCWLWLPNGLQTGRSPCWGTSIIYILYYIYYIIYIILYIIYYILYYILYIIYIIYISSINPL